MLVGTMGRGEGGTRQRVWLKLRARDRGDAYVFEGIPLRRQMNLWDLRC